MDNRKTITLIIILLLLLLCWHFCKRKARVLPIVPIASPPVPKAVRPAYLGQPVIDAFLVPEIPVVVEPLTLTEATVIYNQGEPTNHSVILYFSKPLRSFENADIQAYTITVDGVNFTASYLIISDNSITFNSIISNIGQTVTITILMPDANIIALDGSIFTGVTDFEIANSW